VSGKGSVVIVTYNSVDIISACLNSLIDDKDWLKVIVVDNLSTDGTRDRVRDDYPWVNLIQSEVNGGFGAGNNLGIAEMEGKFCLILNPDCTVKKGCVAKLADYLNNNSGVGCVGPSIENENGVKVVSHYRFTDLFLSVWTAVGLQRFIPFNRTKEKFEIRRTPPARSVKVDRLIGAAMMIRREVIEQVGGFDEHFFLYSEEEDLCKRINESGWDVVYHPDATVAHSGAGTTGHDNPLAIASANHSRYLYQRKHNSTVSAELSRFVWLISLFIRYLFAVLFGTKGRRRGYLSSLRSLLNRNYFETGLRPKH